MAGKGQSVFSNFMWRFAERCGAQGVTFVVSVVLARLLDPVVYGTVALVSVFISILGVFIDSGMGNALIQKKNADDTDFSTVFYFNVSICSVLYAIMFFASPLIARFYRNEQLTAVVRVLSLTILISGVKNIQLAYVSRNMQFKRFFFATLGGTLGAAVVGITLAYLGFGVWALVFQSIFNSAVDTLILWLTVKWRPKRVFSFARLKGLFSYGWKLLVSSILDTGYNNLRSLIIGKMYSPADLAYYNKGDRLPAFIVSNVNSSIDSVLLPAMSSEQDDRAQVKAMMRRSIKMSTYVMAPFLAGLLFCAEPIIRLLLTEKWLPCVPFLRIFCITYMFFSIHTANLNAIKAVGRSDLFLKLEIIKKIVGLLLLFATVRISVMAMAYSLLVSSVLGQIINSWPNRRLLHYGYLEQLKDILPGILLGVAMGFCILPVTLLALPDIVMLLIMVPLGAAIFIGGSMLFGLESFEYLKGAITGQFLPSLKKMRHIGIIR